MTIFNFIFKKTFLKQTSFLFLLIFTKCSIEPLKDINSAKLIDFHPSGTNWKLSPNLLTKPGSQEPDTFWLDAFSESYKYLQEESLYEEYLNKEIIRLTIINSFQNHFMLKIIKEGGKVFLTEKEIQNSILYQKSEPPLITLGYYQLNDAGDSIFEYKKTTSTDSAEIDLNIKVGPFDPLVFFKSKSINPSVWNQLVELVSSEHLNNLPSTVEHCCFDGNEIIIEVHCRNGYYMWTRQNPKDKEINDIINHLIKLSDNQHLIRIHKASQ